MIVLIQSALAMIVALLPPPAQTGPKAEVTLAAMAGKWALVAMERDGERVDATKPEIPPMQLTVKGDTYEAWSGAPFVFTSTEAGTIKVAGSTGKVLRIETKFKQTTSSKNGDEVTKGEKKELWELMDKETLRICRGEGSAWPDGFKTKKDDGRMVWTLTRVKE